MGTFAVGDVILIPFPYADFSRFKRRPALIAGIAEFDNLILCQITSKSYSSKKAVRITNDDFNSGGLDLDSYVRPDKIFTIEKSIIERKVGSLEKLRLDLVRTEVRKLFN